MVINHNSSILFFGKYTPKNNVPEGTPPSGTYQNPADLGLYYLQSRYYDSNTGRFISADGLISTGTGLLGYNMYAYCNNNPIMYVDPSGDMAWWVVTLIVVAVIIVIPTGANHCINLSNETKINEKIEDSYTEAEAQAAIKDYLSKYKNEDGDSPEFISSDKSFQITNSYLVTNRYDRQYVSAILSRTTGVKRQYDNISSEWLGHNLMSGVDATARDADLEFSGDERFHIRFFTRILEILGWE